MSLRLDNVVVLVCTSGLYSSILHIGAVVTVHPPPTCSYLLLFDHTKAQMQGQRFSMAISTYTARQTSDTPKMAEPRSGGPLIPMNITIVFSSPEDVVSQLKYIMTVSTPLPSSFFSPPATIVIHTVSIPFVLVTSLRHLRF